MKTTVELSWTGGHVEGYLAAVETSDMDPGSDFVSSCLNSGGYIPCTLLYHAYLLATACRRKGLASVILLSSHFDIFPPPNPSSERLGAVGSFAVDRRLTKYLCRVRSPRICTTARQPRRPLETDHIDQLLAYILYRAGALSFSHIFSYIISHTVSYKSRLPRLLSPPDAAGLSIDSVTEQSDGDTCLAVD